MSSVKPVVLVPACNRMLGQHLFHVAGKKYVNAVRLAGCQPLVPDCARMPMILGHRFFRPRFLPS